MEHIDFILTLLRCPQTEEPLVLLGVEEFAKIETRLKDLCTQQDIGIEEDMVTQAVTNQSQTITYPVLRGVFGLLPALGLPLAAADLPDTIDGEKRVLVDFYNEFGWQTGTDDTFYKDALTFEDLRPQTQAYRRKCHARVNQELPERGQVLLDCASGPVQIDEYLSFSDNFDWRLCVDISINALFGAMKKLDGKGICVLGDITNLPLDDNCVDACVSLHTIYHIPQDQQSLAISELVRSARKEAKIVIVYSWGSASLIFKMVMKLRAWTSGSESEAAETIPELYFHAHSYQWYQREIRSQYQVKLKVWRSLEKEGLSMVRGRLGRYLLTLLYQLEQLFPRAFGKWGICPMFVITKHF